MATYKSIPALAAYLDRIGAEELNFRRWMVKDYTDNHYYRERCTIRLNADGTVSASHKDYLPTKDEAAAIKDAVIREKFPTCVSTTEASFNVLKEQLGANTVLYPFWDRSSDQIVMVQQRMKVKGKKVFVPWSFWSDGEWRRMEPDRNLPFWKPRKSTGKPRLMIHEGAKTADFVHDLITNPTRKAELAEHPWGEQLCEYEHWGMIGGALAPHRSDYSEIVKEKFAEVVYVCDNDVPGKAALREVSRHYKHTLKGIMFDERFPSAWDMADSVPKSLYTSGGRWKGPELSKLIHPATWATESIMGSNGKPITVLRSEFQEEWFHSVTPETFVHRDWPCRPLVAKEFDNEVRPFSDVEETSRLVKMDAASKTGVLKYNPALPAGIFVDDATGIRYINTHMPSAVKPEHGDPGPWLDFMARLVPDEADRKEALRWIATLVARPDIKMLYGMLMISETQGVGKGTLGEKILAPLVGDLNVSYPSEGEIVDSNYNYWLAHRRLAIVHEIYAGHSAKAYNKLKSVITDRYITVSKKYQASYEIENWLHVFACSNSKRAIQLSTDDRRWFVPRVTEERQPPEYWGVFNKWLNDEGGLGIIRQWASDFVAAENPVERGASSPWSVAKKEVVEEGFSPGMALVAEFLDRAKQEFNEPVVVLDIDLIKMIKDHIYEGRHNDRLERPLTIRKLAKSRGWYVGEQRVQLKEWGARFSHSRLITNSPEIATKPLTELVDKYRPVDVSALAQKWIVT